MRVHKELELLPYAAAPIEGNGYGRLTYNDKKSRDFALFYGRHICGCVLYPSLLHLTFALSSPFLWSCKAVDDF